MPNMELWLVRHGEATHNVDYKLRGEAAYLDDRHTNSQLTPRGQGQARRCVLPGKPDVALTSPLRRAQDTAHIVMQAHQDVPIVVLDCIREFPNGLHTPNRLFRAQDTWNPLREETHEELRQRVAEFLAWLEGVEHRYRKVAVFGHTSFFEELTGEGWVLPHARVVRWCPGLDRA